MTGNCYRCGKRLTDERGGECYECIAHRGAARARSAFAAARKARQPQEEPDKPAA